MAASPTEAILDARAFEGLLDRLALEVQSRTEPTTTWTHEKVGLWYAYTLSFTHNTGERAEWLQLYLTRHQNGITVELQTMHENPVVLAVWTLAYKTEFYARGNWVTLLECFGYDPAQPVKRAKPVKPGPDS